MSAQQSLSRIRKKLIRRAAQHLARGAGVRENFESQLSRFCDMLEQSLTSGDPAWMDTVVNDWANASTQTDLTEGERNATNLLNVLFKLSVEVARDELNKGEALDLISGVLPIFIHCLDRAAQLEMRNRIAFLAEQVSSAQQILERLDRSKSNFISVAAHELKTPLTLIEGYAAMLRDGNVSQSNGDLADPVLSGVQIGIQRLRQIVDDMIDVSLIDNNMLSLNSQPLWISHILNQLERNLEQAVRDRHQNLLVKEFDGANEWMYADPERLYQAFEHLLTNAIKYTPDGGRITVDGRTLPGFVEVRFTDTGIGIPAEDQSSIFEKFGKLGRADLHSSGKLKFKGGGPGLGLSISKGIIEAHGGTLWVESNGYDEKKLPGATFHVLLPLRTESTDDRLSRLFGELTKTPKKEIHVKEENSTHNPAA